MTLISMRKRALAAMLACAGVAGIASCGGGSNPFDNPEAINNPPGVTGQKLSFIYYQRCINPIFLTPLQVNHNGVISTNTCAGGGCHDNTSGTGGAFRVIVSAGTVDLSDPANTPDVVRGTDMYKNFYSAQGEVVLSSPMESRLLTKPMIAGVLHGGGLVFESAADPNVKLINYWISHPMPQGQDEFSTAANNMFASSDPVNGACNSD